MFEYLLFSVPVMCTVWRRGLDWTLFDKQHQQGNKLKKLPEDDLMGDRNMFKKVH
jgi:hypothetical protein